MEVLGFKTSNLVSTLSGRLFSLPCSRKLVQYRLICSPGSETKRGTAFYAIEPLEFANLSWHQRCVVTMWLPPMQSSHCICRTSSRSLQLKLILRDTFNGPSWDIEISASQRRCGGKLYLQPSDDSQGVDSVNPRHYASQLHSFFIYGLKASGTHQ